MHTAYYKPFFGICSGCLLEFSLGRCLPCPTRRTPMTCWHLPSTPGNLCEVLEERCGEILIQASPVTEIVGWNRFNHHNLNSLCSLTNRFDLLVYYIHRSWKKSFQSSWICETGFTENAFTGKPMCIIEWNVNKKWMSREIKTQFTSQKPTERLTTFQTHTCKPRFIKWREQCACVFTCRVIRQCVFKVTLFRAQIQKHCCLGGIYTQHSCDILCS